MAMDKNITGQANKVMVWLMKYYPVRIKNVGEQQKADRQTIWDFKDGRAYEQVALMTAKHLQELFGSRLTSIVFTCVPASTQEKNELRYKRFSERVCELTHAINGYPHMQVSAGRLAVHEYRRDETEARTTQMADYDTDFFKGKDVLLFDDIITKGISYATTADNLEACGANVLGGLFLAKTFYKVR